MRSKAKLFHIFSNIVFVLLRLSCGSSGAMYSFSSERDGRWEEEEKLESHTDWVRDCAWAPSIGLPRSKIASCSQVEMRHSSSIAFNCCTQIY